MDHWAFRKYSKEIKDIILRMLVKNPCDRITPEEALKHPFFVKNGYKYFKMKEENMNDFVKGMSIPENPIKES